jgi:hypothetical protein
MDCKMRPLGAKARNPAPIFANWRPGAWLRARLRWYDEHEDTLCWILIHDRAGDKHGAKAETRRPKPERRPKSEGRDPKRDLTAKIAKIAKDLA